MHIVKITRWEPVVGWEGLYEVSSQGQVRSLPRWSAKAKRTFGGKTLQAVPAVRGAYPQVCLSKQSKTKTYFVHILVARAFLGPCPFGEEVCHIDGDTSNPAARNLHYGTPAENSQDSIRQGTHHYASRNACSAGHEYAPQTMRLELRKDGSKRRACITCAKERRAKNYSHEKTGG